MDRWQAMRQLFPVTEQLVYLDHAAVAPLPRPCREGFETYLDELSRNGVLRYPDVPLNALARSRELGATLLGTDPERIFVVRSTTQGIGLVASGFPFVEGDNVVLVEREFPANIRPWLPLRRRGVDVRLVPQRDGRVLLDELEAAVDARTRVLSISFVQFLSGFRVDLGAVAEICRRNGALFVVDAIQGLGAMPLDVEVSGVDFLSADAHKWMLGPEGVGLGYCSPRALDIIEPAVEGWLSVQTPFDLFDMEQPLRDTPARFEEGAYNTAGIHGMNGSLELLLEQGVDAMSARILGLTDGLCEQLSSAGWTVLSPRQTEGEKSGIVLATREGVDFETLELRLAAAGVVVSVRGGALRVAPHAYNHEGDLERLVAELPG